MDTTYILQDFTEKEADLVYRLKLQDQDMIGIWRDVLKNTGPGEVERKDMGRQKARTFYYA
ncbi:MAG: hypothetical protein K6U80_16140 [Firmicutes bacterium]|nr:hypothetical protein [Bacillota bacterium]